MAVMRRLTVLSAAATSVLALTLVAPVAGAAPGPPVGGMPAPPAAGPAPSVGAVPASPAVPMPPSGAAPAVAPNPPAGAGDRAVQGGKAAPSDLFGVYDAAIDALQAFGMQPFLYPTAAPFCLPGSTFGLAPAVAGAVPGPWPKTTIAIPGLDLTAVKAGQTMFSFLPYGLGPEGPNTTGMYVAWMNTSTSKYGFVPMGPLSDVVRAMIPAEVPPALRPMAERVIQDFFLGALPVGGIRAVPVETGSGTVLAAVFGTVQNGGVPCFFLPTVGVIEVP